jgi:DNA-binding beta-propeller fold protein YncE
MPPLCSRSPEDSRRPLYRSRGVKRALLLLVLAAVPAGSQAATRGGEPVALVTAETQNALLVVDLSSGKVVRRLRMPTDPENVETTRANRAAAVVSTRAGAVTLLSLPRLRVRRVLDCFSSPHIAVFSPDGRFLYVTDDDTGRLYVIDVHHAVVARWLLVGRGATTSPSGPMAGGSGSC